MLTALICQYKFTDGYACGRYTDRVYGMATCLVEQGWCATDYMDIL